jgi:hypothetical protein
VYTLRSLNDVTHLTSNVWGIWNGNLALMYLNLSWNVSNLRLDIAILAVIDYSLNRFEFALMKLHIARRPHFNKFHHFIRWSELVSIMFYCNLVICYLLANFESTIMSELVWIH